jgi:predicted nucleic acid-binding protein
VIVVDTNVLVHNAVLSPLSEFVHGWAVSEPIWCAPWLVVTEFTNVLLGFVRRGQMDAAQARQAIAAAESRLKFVQLAGVDVLQTALDTGLTAYDASFVVAARKLGCRLVTADSAILRACPDVAVALDA